MLNELKRASEEKVNLKEKRLSSRILNELKKASEEKVNSKEKD